MNGRTPFDPDAAATGGGIYGLPHTPEDAAVVLIPVPWEATVSYRAGTAAGPRAILEASWQVDLFDRETGRPYESGIALLPIPEDVEGWSRSARALALPVIEAGGIEAIPADDPRRDDFLDRVRRVDAHGVRMNAHVATTARAWLERGKLAGVVGGDHAVPFGLIQAVAERHPGLGILHIDAHADLRHAYEGFRFSHASIFWNVTHEIPAVKSLVQVGVRDLAASEHEIIQGSGGRIRTFFDADLRQRLEDGVPWSALAREVVEALPREVYVSLDIDGLDPALCPHTGTPVPGGLSFAEAVSLFRHIEQSGRRIVGFDISEVAPDPTGASGWDGNVAARLLYKLIGYALRCRP